MASIEEAIDQRVEQSLAKALAPLIAALEKLTDDRPTPGVWTIDEAAIRLGVSGMTVRRWVRRGLLPTLPHVQVTLIPKKAVEDFINGTGPPQDEQAEAL